MLHQFYHFSIYVSATIYMLHEESFDITPVPAVGASAAVLGTFRVHESRPLLSTSSDRQLSSSLRLIVHRAK